MARLVPPWLAVALFLAAGTPQLSAAGPPAGDSTAGRALKILRARCAGCHGPDGKAKGGFGHVLDRERLVARGQVVPGRPADSPLYDRAARGEMPPGRGGKLGVGELRLLARWIEAGAPGGEGSPTQAPVREADVLRLVLADLRSLEPRDARFARYLTLGHLPAGQRELHRQATTKLVNSLSWHPRLHGPHPVDPARTVFRVDLRWYRWNARAWDRLVGRYPYRTGGATPAELVRLTGAEVPAVRGDWFVATASSAAFYHDFLPLPDGDRALERQLQVDVRAGLADGSAARAGFNGSGVARNNRLLERHDSPYGAYWHSYDFSENTGRQNLFERPLGPQPGPHGFAQAGGEVIFHLPNGLLGFLLVDGAGRRVDKAPGEVVSDPRRPDRLVENGVSCLGCHAAGLIPKDDAVRRHVLGHPTAFPAAVRDAVRALYPSPAAFRALIDEDNERFLAALKKLGVTPGDPEPVSTAVLRYEGVLDAPTAAAEAGCTPDELARRVRADVDLTRTLGPLLTRGTVQRAVFEEAFAALARSAAEPAVAPATGPAVVLRGHRGRVRALAWGPAGLVATAGEDRAVRLWVADTGRERGTLEAGTDEVEALAFSTDGRRLAWAGRDRTVRVADCEGKRPALRLAGHTDAVRALAFAPDGRLFSAGDDRVVRVWDAERGVELEGMTGSAGAVVALAVSADGALLLSGGADRVVRLWDLKAGRLRAAWAGDSGAVRAVCFSADGRRALSGDSAGTVRVWDVATGRALRRLEGHGDSVVAVAFGKGEGAVLSATRLTADDRYSLTRWTDAGVGHPAGPRGRADIVKFSPDGRRALTADGDEARVAATKN